MRPVQLTLVSLLCLAACNDDDDSGVTISMVRETGTYLGSQGCLGDVTVTNGTDEILAELDFQIGTPSNPTGSGIVSVRNLGGGGTFEQRELVGVFETCEDYSGEYVIDVRQCLLGSLDCRDQIDWQHD